jgi:hypothetical protein
MVLWLLAEGVDASVLVRFTHVGGRTKPDAFAVIHDLKLRLVPGIIPAFTTDSLRSYFYALTAHFGAWFRPPRARKDHWKPGDDRYYGSLLQHRLLQGKRQSLFTPPPRFHRVL